MWSLDIFELLELFFLDGFSVETLSKATNVSAELICRCYETQEMEDKEYESMNRILDFLALLYSFDNSYKEYLKSIVSSLNTHFMMSNVAIAKYLRLSIEELKEFLVNPEQYRNGHYYSVKLIHLFMTCVR